MRHAEQANLTGAARCDAAGESLTLLPDRAIWWERTSTLLLADLHLGKAATFRSAGIPVPESTTARDLARLTHLISTTRAERMIVLGDFFHARAGRSTTVESAIHTWRTHHASLDILLIRGNHDRASGDPADTLRIHCHAEGHLLPPFTLNHHPSEPIPGAYTLAGHIHPALRLVDHSTRSSLRLPCFLFSEHGAILPAFGAFTGMKVVQAARTDRAYAIAEDHVVQIR